MGDHVVTVVIPSAAGLYLEALAAVSAHGRYASGSAASRAMRQSRALRDRKTFGGVSQFLSQFGFRAAPLARKPLILNIRRDVRVVVRLRGGAASARHLAVARADLRTRAEADEGARLENESGDVHRVLPKQFFAQSIQRLLATECVAM